MRGRGGSLWGNLWRRVGSCWGLALLPHDCAPRHLDLIVAELVGAENSVVVMLADDFEDVFRRNVGEEATEIGHQVPLYWQYPLLGWNKGCNALALLNLGFQMMWDSLWYSIGVFFVWVGSIAISVAGAIRSAIGSAIAIDIGARVISPLSSSPLPELSSLII